MQTRALSVGGWFVSLAHSEADVGATVEAVREVMREVMRDAEGHSWVTLPLLGISAVDSFLLGNIRLGYNPRYFIDQLGHNCFSR